MSARRSGELLPSRGARDARGTRGLRVALVALVALHAGLLVAALPDYRVSVDSAFHTALGRQYGEHLVYFWDSVHYQPAGRPNLQGPLLHMMIGALGRALGGAGDDYVRANAMLGIACWLAAVGTIAHFARRYGGDRAALIGVAAFAGSGFASGSFYANLPSGWMFVFTPWAVHFFVERRLARAALCAALACYVHLGGFATAPVGLAIAALLTWRWRDLVLTEVGVAALTAPYWVHVLRSLAYYVGQKGDTTWMIDPFVDALSVAGLVYALAAPRKRAFLVAWALAPAAWIVQDPSRFVLQSSAAGAALGGVAVARLIDGMRGARGRGVATALLVLAATVFPMGVPGLAAEVSWLARPYPRILDWGEMREDARAIDRSGLRHRLVWAYAGYATSAIAVWTDIHGEKGHWVEVRPPYDPADDMSVGDKLFVVALAPDDALLSDWERRGFVRVHGGGAWSSVVSFAERPAPSAADAAARAVWHAEGQWIAERCERNALGDPRAFLLDPGEIPRRRAVRGECRTRAMRMSLAMLLVSYAEEPADPRRAQLAATAARGLGWVASLVADDATLDFRTAEAHARMQADMARVAAAAGSGAPVEGAFVELLDGVAASARGGLASRSAASATAERLKALEDAPSSSSAPPQEAGVLRAAAAPSGAAQARGGAPAADPTPAEAASPFP